MAMASTSSSSRPPILHPASRNPRILPLASRAPAHRPLLISLAPPAPARGLRAAAATQQPAYEDEDGDEDEEEYYSDEEDDEEMDVEDMEEEARRAAADLAARLDRELRVGRYCPFAFHLSSCGNLNLPVVAVRSCIASPFSHLAAFITVSNLKPAAILEHSVIRILALNTVRMLQSNQMTNFVSNTIVEILALVCSIAIVTLMTVKVVFSK
jgi:hypothetical protein